MVGVSDQPSFPHGKASAARQSFASLQQHTFVDSVLILVVFDYAQYAVNLAVKINLLSY
jgi:hypothetical protein